MSFLDGKPRVATDRDCNAPWNGDKKNFRCGFCGHRFKIGDIWRCLHTNHVPKAGGNPLVCQWCNESNTDKELIEKWKDKHILAETTMWWFCRE